jgi:DNA-binding NtrC family response regulator
MEKKIRHELDSLDVSAVFIDHAGELGHFVRNGEVYQVALLPASLADMDWWTIWGELALLDRKPAILVYAHSATFQLWSGVLEAGGYDIIVEPFTREKLREAVLRAARCFDESQDADESRESVDRD